MIDMLKHLLSPKRTEQDMARLNSSLYARFNEFMHDNLDWVMQNMPDDAMILIEIEGDEEFNVWAKSLLNKSNKEGHPVFVAKFRRENNSRKLELHVEAEEKHYRTLRAT